MASASMAHHATAAAAVPTAAGPITGGGSGPDRSRADYWFCFLAIQWGHGESDTADRLMQESPKAREKGKSYAAQTARQAAAAVDRQSHQSTK